MTTYMRECIVCGRKTNGSVGENSFVGGVPLCHDCITEWTKHVSLKISAMKGKFSENWKRIFTRWLKTKGIYLTKPDREKVIFT